MKNKIYSHIPAIMFGVLVISFLAAFYVLAWTEPSVAPPGGNVPAPLNVSINAQSKEGALVVGTNSSIVTNPACSPNCAGLIVQYGNVGIGTTNPQATLDIGTGAHGSPRFQVSQATNSFPRLYMGGSSATVSYVVNKINPVTTGYFGEAADTGGYQFRGTGSFYIQGNVGIGTTSPANRLDVEGSLAVGAAYSGTSTAPANGMIIEGNVGIGTATPGVELHIQPIGGIPNSDIALQPSTPRLWTMSVTPDGIWALHYLLDGQTYNGVNDYVPVRVYAEDGGQANTLVVRGGNVGIGTTTPTYQLQLSTNSAAKPTSNTWTVASDARIKDIVGPYNRGLAEILQINPILYTYKPTNALGINDPGTHIGIIAQDVQQTIPEAISVDANGYLHFTADPVNWAVVNAIKELKQEKDAEIASLKAEDEELKARLKVLESKTR